MPTPTRTSRPTVVAFLPVLLGLLLLPALEPLGLHAQDTRRTPTLTRTGEVEALPLTSIRAGAVSAEAAAREFLRFTTVDAPHLARILHSADHPPREIEAALRQVLRVPAAEAQLMVREAAATPLVMDRDPGMIRGQAVDFCVDRMGNLFQCPAGSPITGATVPGSIPATSMNWSGVTLSPANDAPAGGVLVIRPPASAVLPAVEVRFGDQPLPILSASPSEVQVGLPFQGGERSLVMVNLDNGLMGTLEPTFRVREAGFLDGIPAHSQSHEWATSYLLGRVSHLVYSDALGPASQHRNAFRHQMLDWGMWGVEFVEDRDRHVMAAVVWGRDLVLVVFRGSEQHTTAHCFLEMVAGGICAGLPTNWITNLSYRPLQPRSAWGPGVAIHPGFGDALDLVHGGIRDRVTEVLTPERRLFITGHSLGGALATLFAFRAAAVDGLPVQGVYTFGAPRVGNIPFADGYEALLGSRTHRWQNRSDPAPAVPPGQPFQLATTPRQLATDDHTMAGTPGSYLTRIFPNLPTSVRDQVPPPPTTP
ncbi:MAG: lipase family protein [Gemmatimonadales bacterium]|nr:MAG: lipase family protein [Gemmatimonadales bacterium]